MITIETGSRPKGIVFNTFKGDLRVRGWMQRLSLDKTLQWLEGERYVTKLSKSLPFTTCLYLSAPQKISVSGRNFWTVQCEVKDHCWAHKLIDESEKYYCNWVETSNRWKLRIVRTIYMLDKFARKSALSTFCAVMFNIVLLHFVTQKRESMLSSDLEKSWRM